MGWVNQGYIRQGVAPPPAVVFGIAQGSGYPLGIGLGYANYEVHNGLCTVHMEYSLNATNISLISSNTGDLIWSLPVEPVNYDTFYMAGHWWIERFWGGGGYGHLEITRQYSGGVALAKMLINRYHDDWITSLAAPTTAPYLFQDSRIFCSLQYPVEV